MRWRSAVSTAVDVSTAIEDVARDLGGGQAPDLILAFASGHGAGATAIPGRLRARLGGGELLGCTAAGVVGGGKELEEHVALAVMTAELGDVEIHAFHLDTIPEGPGAWHAALDIDPLLDPAFLLLVDPFSVDARLVTAGLDAAYPRAVKLGGLASGGRQAGEGELWIDDVVHRSGLAGIALVGDVQLDPVVAQGARPVGPVATVTSCDGHLIATLDGDPASDFLQRALMAMSTEERARFAAAPLLGLALEGGRTRPGDFLVRNLLGVDRRAGVVAVGAHLVPGMVVQLHVRDAAAATADLDDLLGAAAMAPLPGEAVLMFSCVGRGEGFFGVADHDSAHVRQALGDLPLAGFFCSGELGPALGRTELHGYTTSLAVVRRRGWN